jgi:hypothetical protein
MMLTEVTIATTDVSAQPNFAYHPAQHLSNAHAHPMLRRAKDFGK